MSWKVEFPFLLQTLQTATQVVLPRRSQLNIASRNWINIDRRSDMKIEWRLGPGLLPLSHDYECFSWPELSRRGCGINFQLLHQTIFSDNIIVHSHREHEHMCSPYSIAQKDDPILNSWIDNLSWSCYYWLMLNVLARDMTHGAFVTFSCRSQSSFYRFCWPSLRF